MIHYCLGICFRALTEYYYYASHPSLTTQKFPPSSLRRRINRIQTTAFNHAHDGNIHLKINQTYLSFLIHHYLLRSNVIRPLRPLVKSKQTPTVHVYNTNKIPNHFQRPLAPNSSFPSRFSQKKPQKSSLSNPMVDDHPYFFIQILAVHHKLSSSSVGSISVLIQPSNNVKLNFQKLTRE